MQQYISQKQPIKNYTNPISERNIKEMRNNMDDSDVGEFDKFLERVWGIKQKSYFDDDYVEEDLGETKKRGRKPKTVN